LEQNSNNNNFVNLNTPNFNNNALNPFNIDDLSTISKFNSRPYDTMKIDYDNKQFSDSIDSLNTIPNTSST
jgi:hypothetical protein